MFPKQGKITVKLELWFIGLGAGTTDPVKEKVYKKVKLSETRTKNQMTIILTQQF